MHMNSSRNFYKHKVYYIKPVLKVISDILRLRKSKTLQRPRPAHNMNNDDDDGHDNDSVNANSRDDNDNVNIDIEFAPLIQLSGPINLRRAPLEEQTTISIRMNLDRPYYLCNSLSYNDFANNQRLSPLIPPTVEVLPFIFHRIYQPLYKRFASRHRILINPKPVN